MKLKNKVIIVTGSGRSIGRILAIALAKEGANIIIVARNKKEIKEVSKEIHEIGRDSIAIKADLTIEKDVIQMVKKTLEKFGRIDILINNAGTVTDRIFTKSERTILNAPLSKWKIAQDNNLLTVFLCSKEVGKIMVKQKFGKIINISSNLGKLSVAGFGPYSCAKAGVEMLTKILALELGHCNITVNSLSPSGSIDIKNREFSANIKRESPKELIKPLIKLCTSKITGQSITVQKLSN